jgi:hypothetical protein
MQVLPMRFFTSNAFILIIKRYDEEEAAGGKREDSKNGVLAA